MNFEWDDSLNTGDRELDVHHQAFFVKAQQLSDACRVGRGAAVVKEMIGFLTEYAEHHFRAESQRMEQSAYPYTRTHEAQHEDFLSKLRVLEEKLDRDGPSGALADDVREMVAGWLLEHIKGSDLPLVEFIREQRGGGA